jgi:hypothetical protein
MNQDKIKEAAKKYGKSYRLDKGDALERASLASIELAFLSGTEWVMSQASVEWEDYEKTIPHRVGYIYIAREAWQAAKLSSMKELADNNTALIKQIQIRDAELAEKDKEIAESKHHFDVLNDDHARLASEIAEKDAMIKNVWSFMAVVLRLKLISQTLVMFLYVTAAHLILPANAPENFKLSTLR